MIEISRTTHTYLTMDKGEAYEAIKAHLAHKLNRPLPPAFTFQMDPNGIIIEFTEHEGPEDQRTTNATEEYERLRDLTPDPQEEEGLRQALNDELIEDLTHLGEPDTTDRGEWAVFPEKQPLSRPLRPGETSASVEIDSLLNNKTSACNKPWPPFPPADRKHLSKD